jgi:hypothetical protein
VVAKVEFHCGELSPRVGFTVTNLETDNRAVVRFYSKRGTAEQWIEEGKQALKMTRLSCHRFRSNEVRLWLSVMAYNCSLTVAARQAVTEPRPSGSGRAKWTCCKVV